jgi:hypothetical protein
MNSSLHLFLSCTLLCLAGCTKKQTTITTRVVHPEESSVVHLNCDHCVDVEETEEITVTHQISRTSGVMQKELAENMK